MSSVTAKSTLCHHCHYTPVEKKMREMAPTWLKVAGLILVLIMFMSAWESFRYSLHNKKAASLADVTFILSGLLFGGTVYLHDEMVDDLEKASLAPPPPIPALPYHPTVSYLAVEPC